MSRAAQKKVASTAGLAVLLGALAIAAPAAASQCGLIEDSDQRHLCYARADGSTGQCGLIKDSDLRHYCYAVVGKSTSQCGLIRDADKRHTCYEEAK